LHSCPQVSPEVIYIHPPLADCLFLSPEGLTVDYANEFYPGGFFCLLSRYRFVHVAVLFNPPQTGCALLSLHSCPQVSPAVIYIHPPLADLDNICLLDASAAIGNSTIHLRWIEYE
jgi:hypothetical protein